MSMLNNFSFEDCFLFLSKSQYDILESNFRTGTMNIISNCIYLNSKQLFIGIICFYNMLHITVGMIQITAETSLTLKIRL